MGTCAPSKLLDTCSHVPVEPEKETWEVCSHMLVEPEEQDPWEVANGRLATPFETVDGSGPTTQVGDYEMTKNVGANSWQIATAAGETAYKVAYVSGFGSQKGFDLSRNGKPVVRATMKKLTDSIEWEIYRYDVVAFSRQRHTQKVGRHKLFPWCHISMYGKECIVKRYGPGNSLGPIHLRMNGKWPVFESIIGEEKTVICRMESFDKSADKRVIKFRIAKGCDFGLHVALAMAIKRSKTKH